MKKLAAVVTHPIQYFVPVFRMLAARSDLDLHVFYASDHSVIGSMDEGFRVEVKWDVPMLSGYSSTFMTRKSMLENYFAFFQYYRKEIESIFKCGEFDAVLVHAYDKRLHWHTTKAARQARVPVMLRAENTDCTNPRRGPLKTALRNQILKRFYSRISAFLSIGGCTTRHYLEHGIKQEDIFFSPYCVDDELFRTQRTFFCSRRDEIRGSLGFSKNDFVFMFSGKMIPKKDPLILAEAFNRLPKNYPVSFLAVGEGELKNELQKRMSQNSTNHSVFTGFVNQSQLGRYYVAADALILPSSYDETWGLVVNEAQTFGLPVIVSDVVGCREDLVIAGKTGYIFPAGAALALAECMMRLVKDPERSLHMGVQARELIGGYSVKNAAGGIVDALYYVCEGKK